MNAFKWQPASVAIFSIVVLFAFAKARSQPASPQEQLVTYTIDKTFDRTEVFETIEVLKNTHQLEVRMDSYSHSAGRLNKLGLSLKDKDGSWQSIESINDKGIAPLCIAIQGNAIEDLALCPQGVPSAKTSRKGQFENLDRGKVEDKNPASMTNTETAPTSRVDSSIKNRATDIITADQQPVATVHAKAQGDVSQENEELESQAGRANEVEGSMVNAPVKREEVPSGVVNIDAGPEMFKAEDKAESKEDSKPAAVENLEGSTGPIKKAKKVKKVKKVLEREPQLPQNGPLQAVGSATNAFKNETVPAVNDAQIPASTIAGKDLAQLNEAVSPPEKATNNSIKTSKNELVLQQSEESEKLPDDLALKDSITKQVNARLRENRELFKQERSIQKQELSQLQIELNKSQRERNTLRYNNEREQAKRDSLKAQQERLQRQLELQKQQLEETLQLQAENEKIIAQQQAVIEDQGLKAETATSLKAYRTALLGAPEGEEIIAQGYLTFAYEQCSFKTYPGYSIVYSSLGKFLFTINQELGEKPISVTLKIKGDAFNYTYTGNVLFVKDTDGNLVNENGDLLSTVNRK